MPKFDLSKYATVEERLRAFWSNPITKDARIVTVNHSRDDKSFVIETRIYLTAGDQVADLPKVTGWAQEANTDAFSLERCETSSIGRCLANWLWTGAKELDGTPRPSRQEMEKVAAQQEPDTDWLGLADTLTDVDALRHHYARAKASGVHPEVLERIKERALAVSGSSSVSGGAEGGVSEVSGSANGGSVSAKSGGSAKAGAGK